VARDLTLRVLLTPDEFAKMDTDAARWGLPSRAAWLRIVMLKFSAGCTWAPVPRPEACGTDAYRFRVSADEHAAFARATAASGAVFCGSASAWMGYVARNALGSSAGIAKPA